MNKLKQEFYNALARYDADVADAHWPEFVALHAADKFVSVASYAAYVRDLMEYSDGLKQW